MSKTIQASISQKQIKEMARSVKRHLTVGYFIDLFVYPDGSWEVSEPNTGVSYPETQACVLQFEPIQPEDKAPKLVELCEKIETFIEVHGQEKQPEVEVPGGFVDEVCDLVRKARPDWHTSYTVMRDHCEGERIDVYRTTAQQVANDYVTLWQNAKKA